MEIGQAEILFAQKLSSGEPGVRKKAFNRLEKWLTSRTVKGTCFTRIDFLKLWKGLYYCMWMQDKPLNQEDLCDNITKLLDVFDATDKKLLFIDTFFEEMMKDWHSIDQWRMDKFMMMYRRFFRRILLWLKSTEWNVETTTEVFDILRRTVWNTCPNAYPEGLKIHFASFYLDELDNVGAGDLSETQTFQFLQPYVDLLNDKTLSETFFDTILDEIFKLLLEFAADFMEKKEADKLGNEPYLEFDYSKIKNALFEVGKGKTTTGRRRSRIYSLVKKFDQLISGRDPFYESVAPAEGLTELDIERATENLLKLSSLTKKDRKRKIVEAQSSSDDDGDDIDEFIESKKRKKKKLSPHKSRSKIIRRTIGTDKKSNKRKKKLKTNRKIKK